MALNNGKIIDPSEIIPGRPVDWQLGNQGATDRRTYRALREMDRTKVEGSPALSDAVVGQLLVFTADGWQGQDKRTYLSLDDLTDVSVSAPTTGHILRHNGSLFVNTPIGNLIALDDLSDVTISAVANGDFLVYNSGTSQWGNKNWTPAAFGVGAAPTLAKLEVNTPDSGTRGFVVRGVTAQTADLFQARDVSDNLLVRIGATGPLTLLDAVDVVLGTTTGTKIGTATTQKLGFYNATPIVRPGATTDIKDSLVNLGLITDGGATPLNLDLGTLECGLIAGTQFGGENVPFRFASTQVTFTTDANLTLAVPALTAAYIDIQTDAVLTASRDIIVPLGIGNLWIVRNRNAQAIRIIGTSGTGTTVASGRIAILIGSGANVIRVTPDTVP